MPKLPAVSLVNQAQQRLRDRAAPTSAFPAAWWLDAAPDDVSQLVQELQAQQLELEMQNEEFLLAQAATESARAAAEAARAQYARLYDFAPAALFTLEADGRVAQLNDHASRLLGSSAAHLTGRRFLLFVAPASRDAFRAFFAHLFDSPERHVAELRLQTAAGADFIAHLEGVAGGATAQLAVVDVTALQQEVERRQRSEDRLQLALAASGTGVWAWTFATNSLEWDAQAQACFGRPHDPDPTSFSVLQTAIHPADLLAVQGALGATVHDGQPLDIEHRVRWPNGAVHHVAVNGKVQHDAQGRPEGLTGLIRDVTARRAAEEALGYRNRQLRELLDNLPVLFGRLAPTGEYLELAGAGLRRLGMAENSLVGVSVYNAFPMLAEPTHRLLNGEPVSFMASAEALGQRVHFQNYGYFDEQRQQGVVFGIDVTESEQTKERLRREQEFTKSLLDHYVDGVAAFDHTGRLTVWNRAMEDLTGRPEAAALGQDVFACLQWNRTSGPGQLLADLLHGTRQSLYHQAITWPNPAQDFELTAIPLPGAAGPVGAGGLLLLRDVTERNRLHAAAAQLKAQQQRDTFRMVLRAQEVERKRIAEALHNGVGQLLYATKLRLEAAGAAVPPAALALLEEAIKATRTVSFELTPSILEDFGLAVALQRLAKSIPPEKLRLHLYLAGLHHPLPNVLTVAVYRMVQEMLNNVVKHARAEEATLHVAHEGGHVHVSMEDNGGGFDVATAVDAAKGIGLASLYNRAALLGGHFDLVSRPGRGTIATLTLPVAAE